MEVTTPEGLLLALISQYAGAARPAVVLMMLEAQAANAKVSTWILGSLFQMCNILVAGLEMRYCLSPLLYSGFQSSWPLSTYETLNTTRVGPHQS